MIFSVLYEAQTREKLEFCLKEANEQITELDKNMEEKKNKLKESEEREKQAREKVHEALESLQEAMENTDAIEGYIYVFPWNLLKIGYS